MRQEQAGSPDPASLSLNSLRRITRALDIHSRKLYRECSITSPQFLCLHCLSGSGSQTLSSLAGELNLGISTTNGIVDRLEAKGLVARNRSRQDQRKVIVDITKEGSQLLGTIPELMSNHYRQAFGKLAPQDQRLLAELLGKLAGQLDTPAQQKRKTTNNTPVHHDIIESTGTDYQLHRPDSDQDKLAGLEMADAPQHP
ncbi:MULTISPECIES: MarR family winged helix-turn-helix transcriptional regulator [Prosthecochloris]|uniref:Winged helix-turn-helix transcriptional regulator n=1 Tax=Prosthecochloris vibrioformis TaxID=1098 RepID=A0A5C4RYI0_PROVB|nr:MULTISPECIES: MarR family winged helix-turn-helix transcriptional regulator [Prosthecochloris]ANT65238.1 Regulator of autolytic activity [Prosthecochloris sp. CIB 2401]TNJ36018.1 winged helix-turn-helix transcriptional regulator [Prosthecochloris vibrioformis]